MPAALCLNVKRDLEPLKHQMVWREMSCFLFFLSSYYPFICWLSFLSITSGIRYSFTWSHPGYYSRFHFHSLFFRSSWLFFVVVPFFLFSLFSIFLFYYFVLVLYLNYFFNQLFLRFVPVPVFLRLTENASSQ